MTPPQTSPRAILVDLPGHRMDGITRKWAPATYLIRTHQAGKEDKWLLKSQTLNFDIRYNFYIWAQDSFTWTWKRGCKIITSFLCWSKNSRARMEIGYFQSCVCLCLKADLGAKLFKRNDLNVTTFSNETLFSGGVSLENAEIVNTRKKYVAKKLQYYFSDNPYSHFKISFHFSSFWTH